MKKIKIDKRRDYLIIEKFKDDTILKDSHVYCGCCGESIGKMKKKLSSPIYPHVLLKTLKKKSVDWTIIGLYHEKCKHSMFCFKKSFDLISLDNYNKSISYS